MAQKQIINMTDGSKPQAIVNGKLTRIREILASPYKDKQGQIKFRYQFVYHQLRRGRWAVMDLRNEKLFNH